MVQEAGGSRNIIRNQTIEKSIAEARQRLYERQYAETMQSVPGFIATAHLPNQSPSTGGTGASNFTSGNPGSSTSTSEKGKSTNFSKKNSDNWSLSSITGFVSNLVGASPQESQFSPSMHDTAAASSYYPSNQPDDGTLGSMITPRNQKGFYGTPYFPNQLQSTGWPGASNYFSPTPNTSNFTSGNPGSSAIPFQQVPMPGTSFPSFPNYLNQSAQLNSSTIFGPFQTETHSLDWSGGNSHNNTGTLDSVVNKRKPSSSKDKNATKTGKKPIK
ncbi:hypothetical protein GPALN_005891 [Globodera pallida]|nr:hypothetical protein GPALN_005891 [Globodera pallida]